MPGVTFTTDETALLASVGRYLQPWLQAKLDSIAALAVDLCPVDTGFMRDQHTTEIDGSGTDLVGRVRNTAPYAVFVHEGRDTPYDIPKSGEMPKGKWLRFPDKAGTIVYTKHVTHPGYKAQPWLKDAAERIISISSGP